MEIKLIHEENKLVLIPHKIFAKLNKNILYLKIIINPNF